MQEPLGGFDGSVQVARLHVESFNDLFFRQLLYPVVHDHGGFDFAQKLCVADVVAPLVGDFNEEFLFVVFGLVWLICPFPVGRGA